RPGLRARPSAHLRLLRAGAEGISATPSADDGGAASVRLRRRGPLFPQDRAAHLRGRRLSSHRRRIPSRPHADQRVSAHPPRRPRKLFVQVLRLCANAGLIKLGHVAIDGTKMKANASKHKAMSYKRMKEEEAKLRAKVQALLEAAERIDREEDALYGEGVLGDELPEELRRSE